MLATICFAPRRTGSPRPRPAADAHGPRRDSGDERYGESVLGPERQLEWGDVPDRVERGRRVVAATPRASLTVDGFAPGAAAWFRVTAINASVASTPSATVAIYGPSAPAAVRLRVA